jgi:hypothetical protein
MRNETEQQPDEHHTVDWATTRPVVSGSGGVISSGHPLVSMAGMRMLLSGGNAFDAAAAAGFAAAVIEPTASYSLCSECVAILHDAKGRQTLVLSGKVRRRRWRRLPPLQRTAFRGSRPARALTHIFPSPSRARSALI